MKASHSIFLNTAGMMILLLAVFHTASYVFGWTQIRQTDLPGAIIGGIAGTYAGWFTVRRLNLKKARQARNQPS